jgi:hypothetical protein
MSLSVIALSLVALTPLSAQDVPPLPPPEAYLHASDQARARRKDPNDLPCTKYGVDGHNTVSSVPTDQCYKMLPATRMRGIWIDAFEGSQFYPDRSTLPSNRDRARPMFWLELERGQLPRQFRLRANRRVMLVEFIGRRTKYRAPSGHFGMFDYEIIVDRVISARELPPTSTGRTSSNVR